MVVIRCQKLFQIYIREFFLWIFLGIHFSLSTLTFGQTVQLDYLTINDGLSDNYVSHIQQDRFGYLWFGTMEGLNRFDGQAFYTFRNIPDDSTSISDNYIRSFDEDENGNLYIATNTGGLNYYNRKRESFRRISLRNKSGKEFESVSIIRCSQNGIVWIGTQEGILIRFNVSADSVEWSMAIGQDFVNAKPNSINDIFLDASSNLWIASGLGGLDHISFPEGRLNHILKADTLAESFRRNGCVKIIEDSSHKLWISRVSGLDSYDPFSGESEHFGFLDAKGEMLKSFSVLIGHDDRILLSSYYDLIEFDISNSTHRSIASILPQYFTSALYMDRTGIIWAGTMGYGIIKIDPGKGQFNTSKGNFLAETYPEEIALLSDSAGFDLSIRDRDFLSIIRDRNQDAWVATQFWGLYRIDHSTHRIERFTIGELNERQRYQVMYQVFEDRKGEIWVSTVGGISKLNQETGQFEYHRIYPGENISIFAENKATYLDITDIHQDETGVFWLGTPEIGLVRFDLEIDSLRFIHITPSQSATASSFTILSILPDPVHPNRILWIGTEGGGLVQFDKETHTSRFYTDKEGLPNNIVNCVLPGTDNDIWMSTNMGLSRFSISTEKFLNFDVRDGLQSNGYNRREAYISPDGELYFGGTYGYNHFFSDDIIDSQTHSPLVLTGIDLFNKPISLETFESPLNAPVTLLNNLTLDHEQGMMVTFYYTALTYSNPHRDRFAYKLDGFDSRWIENGTKRFAVYTNLNPGKYRFRVRHLDDVYASDPQELSLWVEILPPFWATWWFRSSLILLAFFVVGSLIRRQLNRLQKKRMQQRLFSQQLLEYQENERKRISSELHDGVGQNLLVIKNTLQLGLNNLPMDDHGIEHFQSASEIISETIQEVREISHNLIPLHLEQLGLTSTLESVIENVERACEISFEVDIEDIDNLLSPESEILIYRIVQESLNNIIKHSQADYAEVNISKKPEMISIRIADNGVGYSPSKSVQDRGIGISGMRERAQLLHGQIIIEPGAHSGTVVQLTIKLDR